MITTHEQEDSPLMVEVRLMIPMKFNYQLVYRQERNILFLHSIKNERFFFCVNLSDVFSHFKCLKRFMRVVGIFKMCLKVMTKKRFFYGVQHQNEIVHCGWVNIGFCRYYLVEKNAIVIGPIWTSEKVRGKGLATWALQEAMDTMIRNGFSIFYIDTERDNLPCQKVIEKSGFGLPVAVYLRKCATTILA